MKLRLPSAAKALWDRVSCSRACTSLAALAMVAVIAALDYWTGYEIRLAILYMLPIALATWFGGVAAGTLVSATAVACWGISFRPNHVYSSELFYYWEGLLMVATFAIFMALLHRLRRALAQADSRFLHVLNGFSAAIHVLDEKNGNVLYANRHCADMLKTAPDAASIAAFEARLTLLEPLGQAAPASDSSMQFNYQEARDEVTGDWYLVQSTPLRWVNNERVTLRVVMNITERKQALVLKRQHQDMLHNTARFSVLAEIASMLGHEINQPLMAITAYNNASIMLLSRSEPDLSEVIAALEKCKAQAIRASHIVDRTRSFLQRRSTTLAHCDINEVIIQAAQSLELDMHGSAISFAVELEETLPETVFDRVLIEQVVVNLLRNAIDAVREQDSPVRKMSVRTAIGEGGAIQVSVSDSGPGISAAVAERLYTAFFSTKPQGLGLGLCICRSIIEAHAGRLWHSTSPETGTAFHFTLPRFTTARDA